MLRLVHLLGRDSAIVQECFLLAILCHILCKRVALNLCQHRHRILGVDLLEGDAHVANVGSGHVGTIIHHIATLLIVGGLGLGCACGTLCSSESLSEGSNAVVGGHRLGSGVLSHCGHTLLALERAGSPSANATLEHVRNLVGAKVHHGGSPLCVGNLDEHTVHALILGIVERARIDGFVNPLALVGVGGNHFLAATQFVATLLVLILHVLIVLYSTTQTGEVALHRILVVGKNVVGDCLACGVNHLALKVGSDLVDVLHFDGHVGHLVEGGVLFHHITFIPPQQYCASNEHNDASKDTAKGILHSRTITVGCYFCISHSLMLIKKLVNVYSRFQFISQ